MNETNMDRILITGVSGVVGRILFNHLIEKYQVFGIDQHKNISTRYQKQNTENLPVETILPIRDECFFECDITDKQKLFEIVQRLNINIIIHLAAILEDHPDKDRLYRINVQGTKNIFETNVKRILFASSVMTVFGYLEYEPYRSIENETFNDETMLNHLRQLKVDEDSPLPDRKTEGNQLYSETKILAEQMTNDFIEKTNKSIVTMRLGWVNIYDNPGTTWLRTVWLSHRDLCLFVDKVLQSPLNINGIYFVTSNNHRSWLDINKAKQDFNYIPLDGATNIN